MKLTKLKRLATVSAVALGMAVTNGPAQAQTENLTATLETNSAITSNVANNLDFGEWFINFVAGDTPVLTMNTNGALTVTQTGAVGNGSQLVQITAPTNRGEINVQTPAPSLLDITCTNIVDFVDGGLTLNVIRYDTATQPVTACDNTADPVTVVSGGTDELVSFGGDITVSATPGDGTHTATFQVDFAY
jgi:hypothetical protein